MFLAMVRSVRVFVAVALVCGVVSVPAVQAHTPDSRCTRFHVALPNDSWFGLAARFNLSRAVLLRLNGATLSTPLFVGNRVCLGLRSSGDPSSAGASSGNDGKTTSRTTTTTTTTTTTVASGPIAPVVTIAEPVACRPIQVSWRGASPDTGLYSLQWVRVSQTGTYDFNTYTMFNVRGTSTALPDWMVAGATYAIRVFAMHPDWDGVWHSTQNVTPHSQIATFSIPSCTSSTDTSTTTTTVAADPWSQRGVDIDGLQLVDRAGESVALSSDGSVLAVGIPGDDGNGTNSGTVRVYAWNGSSWSQRGLDIDGESANDESGNSVALSSDGSVLAIGAPTNDGGGISAGHVRVYTWNGSAWSQRGDDIDGIGTNDFSGDSVALSSDGSILAVGAPSSDLTDSGYVRVYQWSAGAWSQRGSDINGEAAADRSGISVALSSDGSVLAIGAYQNDGNGSNSGHVRVYQWSAGAWSQRGSDINGEATGDNSGHSVSLSSDGSVLAIGAPYNSGAATNSGHVRVYTAP